METVVLHRTANERKQVLGDLLYNGEVLCKTLELPWLENARGKSCIPWGEYTVVRRTSPKYGEHFHILEVPNRRYILIHAANYVHQLLGCVAVGMEHKDMNRDGLRDVTNSKATMKMLLSILPREAFKLRII